MLSCKDISHLASDFTDKNLSSMMKIQMKVHLFICKDCRNFIKQFQLSINAIKQAKPHPIDLNIDETAIDLQAKTLMNAKKQMDADATNDVKK